MNMTLQEILTEALEDEYKARAMYRKVIDKFGPEQPFINIVEAEKRHISVLIPLFEKYNIPIPEDHWDSRLQAPDTLLKACQAGVDAEIDNMTMYKRLLAATVEPDVARILSHLQAASRDNHLPAFQRCLEGGNGFGQRDRQKNIAGKRRRRHGQ